MNSSKAVIASVFVSFFIMYAIETGMAATPFPIDCGGDCKVRCSLSSRPNLCLRACGTCCSRCKCVPSGTSGNEEECPCYAKMTTHGGKRKCP